MTESLTFKADSKPTELQPVHWRCHTPNLMKEIMLNKGVWALRTPMTIFGSMLYEVADRAVELNDQKLNALMLRLTLYESADPELEGHDAKATQNYINEGMKV